MIEVPSMLWQLDEICARVDFLSVGSNDLVQYIYAADRDNKRVSERFDALSTPILRALQRIVDIAARTATPVSLCGEMGGKTLDALALIAIGYRALSMSPASIGPVKAMILALDVRAAAVFVAQALDADGAATSLRGLVRGFAEEQGIPL